MSQQDITPENVDAENIKPEDVDAEVVLADDEIAGISGGAFRPQTSVTVRVG
jgi:hypothetical protein